LTSDHGEEFVAGRRPHGNGLLTEDVVRVPLLVHMPGQREGRRIETPVGHLDLAPTILEAVYGRAPAGLAGQSLLGPLPAARAVAAWGLAGQYFATLPGTPSVAIYQDRFKYMRTWPDAGEALFDLTADPGAERDLARARPAIARALRARMQQEFGDFD
ncbi:MAG: sulfatase/phosphatase domain-containing protein, partial [Candidatus Sericytochromatia bacterium]